MNDDVFSPSKIVIPCSLFIILCSTIQFGMGKEVSLFFPPLKKEEGEKDNKFILLFLTTIQRSGLNIPIRCHTRKPL
jgi:hypothetical protein